MDESTATEMSTPSVVNESTDQDTANTSAAQPAAQETTVKRWNLRVRKPRVVESPVLPEDDEDDEEYEEEEEEAMDEGEEEEEEEEYRGRNEATKTQANTTTSSVNTSTASVSSAKKTPAARKSQAKKREATELKAPPSKRKAAATSVSATPSRAQVLLLQQSAQKGKKTGEKHESRAQIMFRSVLSGKSALKAVASEWVDYYQQDAESALLELVQYFVYCCGCKANITMDMFRAETSDVIRMLTENFAEESGEYPLIVAGPAQKKFKSNFVDFISHIILQCQHSIIYDEYMLDTLIIWLVGFTDSQVRAFRHTSTLACVKLLTAIISVAINVSKELDNTQRQVEAERKRQLVTRTEAGQAKLEKLVSKRGDLTRNKNELEDTMKGLFSSVFVHRYKDVRPEIRAVCIAELGTWLIHYSVKFLADTYLKYIGWMLYDKVGEVRVACLNVLEPLYSDPDTAPHLELFTEKFKSRILSMRLDVDEHAAVTAITVLSHMQILDLLDAEESLEVCELVFLENRAISHTAGRFAVEYLFSEDFMSRAKQREVPAGCKKPTDGQIKLTELIKFFSEVRIHDHANYFVDSLWDHTEVLQDWEAMTQLLLDDKCGITLSDEEQCVLIEIMACSVRRASGATPPPGRAKGKILSNKEKKAIETATEALSSHFMVTLPDLLSKCGSDPTNAANLVSIPQHFNTEIYAESRLQKHLEELLSQIGDLTTKHIESSVLEECAQTYKGLLDTEFSLYSTVDVAFRQLLDQLAENFRQYYSECKEQENILTSEDNEDCFGVLVATRRLASFYKIISLSRYNLSVELKELLEAGVNRECSDSILENVITCLRLDVMWGVHALQQASAPDRDRMRALHSDMLHLFKHCRELVKCGSGRGQREAYVTFADLLMVFAKQLRKISHLASLVYVPDSDLQLTLQEYIMTNVMESEDDDDDNEPTSQEEALKMGERLNDRRVLLASFLKLAMFSVIDNKLVAPIWAQYIRQYHNFGDLIKLSLNRCRESNPTSWYKTVIATLRELFLAHLEENGGERIDQTSPDWADLKELAKKFALSLGFDATKVRLPLVGIHREGILFAVSRSDADSDPYSPPPFLDFLLVLTEFCHRLLYVDRVGENSGVLPFLIKQLPPDLMGRARKGELKGWDSLLFYRQHTLPVYKPAPGRLNRKRGQKATVDDEADERPAKAARINITSPAASEEAQSESGTPPPGGGGSTHRRGGASLTNKRKSAAAGSVVTPLSTS